MATNTTNLNIANLDFDSIKASLRNYLRSQTVFQDYNFEGSGLSVLLDVLSLNTHYMAFYMSMIGNEMFLDSASLRSSVVSLAKQLGYTPRSVRAARASVAIDVTPNDDATVMVIAQGSRFMSTIDGITYTFVTDAAYASTLQNSVFHFDTIGLVQGIPYTYSLVVDSTIPNQRFVLPNNNIDTSTLRVRVQQSATDSTFRTYTLADNFLQVTATTPAYFLQEVEGGNFEVYFGDGVIGQAVIDGNIIIVDYIATNGIDANGASVFVPAQRLSGYNLTDTTVTTMAVAFGGLDAESMDSIRFSAPKNFETQSRAVTASDYKLLIENQYQNAASVVVWGGDEENPPQYGKVFISVKPTPGFVMTEAEKDLLVKNVLKQRNVMAVIPQLVDPDYTFIVVDSTVKYMAAQTQKTLAEIQKLAYDAIISFSTNELDKFDVDFKYSRMLAAVDACDPSVTNNIAKIWMKKTFTPILGAVANYNFAMNNAILPGSIASSSFVEVNDPLLTIPYTQGKTYRIGDDGKGKLTLTQSLAGIADQIVRNCGTVDYKTGMIQITEIVPYQADAKGQVSLSMQPVMYDVIPVFNNILYIDPADVTVTVLPVTQ